MKRVLFTTTAVAAAAAFLAGTAPRVAAQTWFGNVNANWSKAGNWSTGAVPVSSNNTVLTFDATPNASMNDDIPGTFVLNQMTFNAGSPTYSLTGNGLEFRTNGSSVAPSIVMNSNNSVTIGTPTVLTNNLTLSGTGTGNLTYGMLSGPAGLTYSGAGTMTLTAANGYSGSTVVTSGTLSVAGFLGALPSGRDVTVGNGSGPAVLNFNTSQGNSTPGTALGTLTLNGGTFQAHGGELYLSQLVMTGGTVDLSAASSFVLHLANSAAGITVNDATPPVSTLAGNATSWLENNTAVALPITVKSDFDNNTLDVGIVLSKYGSNPDFIKAGSGTMRLTNTANTANLTVSAGNLRVDDMAYLGTGSLTISGGTLQYGGPPTSLAKALSLKGNANDVQVLTAGANLTLTGLISQSAAFSALALDGPGTFNLTNNNNSFTGPLTVELGGVLNLPTIPNGGGNSPIGASSNAPANLVLGSDYFGGRGTLLLTGTGPNYTTDRGATVMGDPSFGSGGAIGVANRDTTLTWPGQITSQGVGGSLIKTGPGTLVLTNATNNYVGGTYVEAGTLTVGADGSVIPTNTDVTVSAGAAFQLGFTNFGVAPSIRTLTLNGGAFTAAPSNSNYSLNRLVIGAAGGTLDFSNGIAQINLIGTGAGVTINANSTWLGDVFIDYSAPPTRADFTIVPNATLTNHVYLSGDYRITGGGTLYMASPPSNFDLTFVVSQGRLRSDDLSVNQPYDTSIFGRVFPGFVTLDGGILQYSGQNAMSPMPIALTAAGGTLEVSNPATTLIYTGAMSSLGPLVKGGPGVLILNNLANSYVGGITVNAGRLDVGDDAQLGVAAVTVNPAGTLRYTAGTTTSRTFNLAGGTLEVPSGVMLTLNGAAVNGGFLHGPGTFAVTGGTSLAGVTTSPNAVISQNGAGSFVNFTNGGALTVAAGAATPSSFSTFTNQGSGSITIAANSQVNAAEFQTYGTLTLSPGSMAAPTLLTNAGSSPLYFNGGSRTFIATPQTAGQFLAGIDLNGKNAIVAGGLFVNNGYVIDSTGGSATVVADFGSLVKGAGFYQNGVITINGGKFQAGNSPGVASFGKFVLGPGGVDNYVFAIDDATGVAGPSPDALGHVSGWGLVRAGAPPVIDRGLNTQGDFTWTATPAAKLAVALETLVNRTTVGMDMPGPMDHFDPMQSYSWPAVQWAGNYSGPADAATLDAATAFDTGSFLNPVAGTFGWSLDPAAHSLSLTYTPSAVPEPGTLALAGLVIVGLTLRRRLNGRRRPTVITCGRLGALALFAFTAPAIAQNGWTWSGATSGNWSTANNWQGGTVPASGINTQLTFDATTHPSMNNDLAGPYFLLNKLAFNAGDPTYSLTGTALDFRTNGSSVGPSIVMDTNNSVTINNGIQLTNNLTVGGAGTGNLIFNSNLTGAGSLTYSEAGTLSLGASNTYSGGTFVISGTLALVGFFGVLPPGQNVTIGNGSGPATLNANNVSNNSTAYAIGTLTLNGGTFHAPGGLGGDFYLNKLNMTGGTVDLSASPNYVLHFVNAGAGISVNPNGTNGTTATWTGANGHIQNDTGGTLTITVNPGCALNAGIALSGTGTTFSVVSPDGSGVIVLSNTGNTANLAFTNMNVYTNNLSTDLGSGAFGTLGTGTISFAGRGLTYTGGTATSAKSMTFAGGNSGIQVQTPGTNLTLSGIIGGGVLQVAGPFVGSSTLTLTNNNTFTGRVEVNLGAILAIPTIGNAGGGGVASPLGSSSNAPGNLIPGAFGYRGDLLLTGTNPSYSTDRGATVVGLYATGGGGGIGVQNGVQNGGTTLFWNGQITSYANDGSLIKTGAGTLTLQNSSNNYAGGTYVEGGTLRVGAPGAVPSAGPLNLIGGTFDTNGFNQTVGSLAGAAGTTVLTGGATLIAGSDNTSTTFAGNILGGQLTKVGSGVLTLAGLGNTANLVTVGTGALAVSDMAALGTGIVALQGAGENGGGLLYTGGTAPSSKNITLANSSTIQVKTPGANLTLTGVISEPVGSPGQELIVAGPFTSFGTPSTLTLAPVTANTYTGKTFVVGNTVVAVPTVTNAGVAGPLGAVPTTDPSGLVLQGCTLLLTGTNGPYSTNRGVTLQGAGFASGVGVNDANTMLTISGEITGPGTFHKVGTGTLVLRNGTNNYTGDTYVDGGRLTLGNATAVPAGSYVFLRGGTFDTGGFPISIGGVYFNNGGTLRATNSISLNQLYIDTPGGTIDATGAGPANALLSIQGPNQSLIIKGDSTWTGPANFGIANATDVSLPISIAPTVTVTSGLSLASTGSYSFINELNLTGGGTLYLTNPAYYTAIVRVSQGRLRMDSLANVSYSFSGLGFFFLALDGGTLQYGGPTASADSFALTNAGGTVEVLNVATTLMLTGPVYGTPTSPLTKAGPGTLDLANSGNAFNSLMINGGTVQTANDNTLGQGLITVGPFGTMRYTATTATARMFTLNFGALEAAAGVTLTLNGAAVGGGFLRGTGTFSVTGGSTIAGATSAASTTINVTGPASFSNFTNGGSLYLAAGSAAATTLDLVTNQGSGSITVAATSKVNVADFQTYGTLTVTPATVGSGKQSLLTNVGATPLYFNGGSRTFIATPQTAGQFLAGIDLNGKNAVVAGGLFVNNGFVIDGTGGTATVVADFGSLVKGAGFYQNGVITINGGKFQAGNSPGKATFGSFTFGPGGVDNYVFAIDDAAGTAGPSPDALGHVSGWGLVKAVSGSTGGVALPGDFAWTASPADKLTLSLDTLVNPTTVGVDVPGPMDHFDPERTYFWPAVQWTGSYTGPADAAYLDAATAFDTGGFANPVAGTFGWQLDLAGHTLSLVYTPVPVPEPSTLALLGVATAIGWRRRRRILPRSV